MAATMNYDALFRAFSARLVEMGLTVLREDGADQVSALVVSPDDPIRGIALFQAIEPEFVGLTLDNGSEFWDNEWSEPDRLEMATEYAIIVRDYIKSGSTPKPRTVVKKTSVLTELLDLKRFCK